MSPIPYYIGFAFWITVILIALSSCATYDVSYHSPDGKQVARCYNSGWGWIGVPAAAYNQNKCEKTAESKGMTKTQ